MVGKQLTTEQLLKIVGEGSYDLGFHDGVCHVLEKLKEGVILCEEEGGPWVLTEEELKKWAIEEFNINIIK